MTLILSFLLAHTTAWGFDLSKIDTFIDLREEDQGQLMDLKKIISDEKQNVIVMLGASWCTVCRDFISFYTENHIISKHVPLVVISVDRNKSEAKSFLSHLPKQTKVFYSSKVTQKEINSVIPLIYYFKNEKVDTVWRGFGGVKRVALQKRIFWNLAQDELISKEVMINAE